jgi:hypothetical protein
MHIRLALAAFKAQYGYETCALDMLESKLIRPPKPISPFPHRGHPESSNSSSCSERIVRSSSRRQVRKEYNDYGKGLNQRKRGRVAEMKNRANISETSSVVHRRSWTPTRTSPQRYYGHRESTTRPIAAAKAYLTPTSPFFNRYPPSITADESAKRSTTPNNGSLTPRSLSPPRLHHLPTRQQSPTPQKPTAVNGSLWDQCSLAYEPSVDETDAANLLMGLWYAR